MMAATVDLLNRTIAGYRCVTRINAGGTGAIWKAENIDGEVVAIKIIHPQLAKTRQSQSILLNEYRLCKSFGHPGLLRYIACGVFEGAPYMVMEHFPGAKLKDCIAAGAPCAVREKAREIIIRVAEALGHIHAHGIVHRDVKPDNILVNAEAEIRLIDFSSAIAGMAKWLPFVRKSEGTPSYIAPEQIRRHRATPAADMYSLGATVYEMFAGRPPFVGNTPNEVLNRHLKSLPETLVRFVRDINPEFDGLVRSMLAKDPAQRPRDMAALVRQLKRIEICRP